MRFPRGGAALVLSGVLVAALAACGDSSSASTATLRDGTYKGSASGGGAVGFTIAGQQLKGTFSLGASTSCGQIGFILNNVSYAGGNFTSATTDKTVITVGGAATSDQAASGEYHVAGDIQGKGHCEGNGTWVASWTGGGGSGGSGGGGNSSCSCSCKCTGCSYTTTRTCTPPGPSCSSCSTVCSSGCSTNPNCGSYVSGSGSCS